MANVHFSSQTDLWSTPQDLYESLDAEYHFTLDPCADDNNHKTEKYYTVEDDGLSQDWSGHTVFMNPPYGRQISQWVKKAYESNTTVVCLLPSRTDTRWWHDYCMKGDIVFIKGRLKFGNAQHNAPFPSAIVIFKEKECESTKSPSLTGK